MATMVVVSMLGVAWGVLGFALCLRWVDHSTRHPGATLGPWDLLRMGPMVWALAAAWFSSMAITWCAGLVARSWPVRKLLGGIDGQGRRFGSPPSDGAVLLFAAGVGAIALVVAGILAS